MSCSSCAHLQNESPNLKKKMNTWKDLNLPPPLHWVEVHTTMRSDLDVRQSLLAEAHPLALLHHTLAGSLADRPVNIFSYNDDRCWFFFASDRSYGCKRAYIVITQLNRTWTLLSPVYSNIGTNAFF